MLAARMLPSLLLAACAVACAGTSSVDIPTTDTSSNEPVPTDDAIPTGSATAAAEPVDAGADVDAPPPAPACAAENEPNNAADDATAFATCFEGVLDTTRDRDFWMVTAPAGATALVLTHVEAGPIAYRVYEDSGLGAFFPTTFTTGSPRIAVTAGAKYLVRLTASGANPPGPRGYQATATFE